MLAQGAKTAIEPDCSGNSLIMSELKSIKLNEKSNDNRAKLRAPGSPDDEGIVDGLALPSVVAATPSRMGDGSEPAPISFCKNCGKSKREGRKGTMTAWIFSDAYCRCTEQATPPYQDTEKSGTAAQTVPLIP